MFKILSSLITLAILGWVVLFFSGKAVLFNESTPTQNGMMQTFTCQYFDGMKVLTKDQIYSDIPLVGQVGSARCPRLITVDGTAPQ
ncbi:MAG: hypothetical protein WAZ18_01015 [Alphaproteobacteria bacterium]